MKRASTKKAKAVPSWDNIDGLEQPKLSQPEDNRRTRTSAAMIGLAISMGASSLLLAKQSDRVIAAEPPASNESTVSTVPAPTESMVGGATNSGEPESVSQARQERAEGATTTQVGNTQKGQQGQTLWQVSQRYEVDATVVTTAHPRINEAGVQAGQVAKIPPVNQVQQVKGKTVPPLAESYGTDRSSIVLPEPAVTSEPPKEGEPVTGDSEVNTLLKAKQAAALNLLKQKSNRLRDSLAEWRSEDGSKSSTTAPTLDKEQSTLLASPPTEKGEVVQQPETIAETAQPKVAATSPTAMAAEMPKSAVLEPTAVVPSVLPEYRVQAGDTLSTIARDRGIPLSELVKVNHLDDPNRLQINQRLVIPTVQRIAVIPPQPEAGATTTTTLKVESPKPTVPVLPSRAPTVANTRVSVPQLSARESSRITVTTVPAESIAGAPFLPHSQADASPGDSQSPVPLSQPKPSATPLPQLAQSTAGREASSNPYIENLRAEIVRLREKYQSQQAATRVVPVATAPNPPVPVSPVSINQANPVSVPILVPPPNTAVVPTEPGKAESSTLPVTERLQSTIKAMQPQAKDTSIQTTGASVATAPAGVNPEEPFQSLRGRHVSPELPPLPSLENYLPNPTGGNSVPLNSSPLVGYIWPTKGVLTSGFGWRWGRMHKGIDIAAPTGTPIFAAAPGVVVAAGWNSGGYGNMVDIQHPDGSLTRYAHNSRVIVRVGQQVEQGQQISEMGSTGYSTGPHCHFEVHPSGKGAVNPIAFLPRRTS